jgi:hypothetical protein
METTPLYVLKRSDGSFKFYVDPDYAKDQGVPVDKLICVEIPNTIYAQGSVDDLSTYIAHQLEQRGTSSTTA